MSVWHALRWVELSQFLRLSSFLLKIRFFTIKNFLNLQPWDFDQLLQWFDATAKYPGYADCYAQVMALLREQAKGDAEKKAHFVDAAKAHDQFVSISTFVGAYADLE